MRIANPIYDAAFKYLLDDTDIAKGLIGRIIGEEIVELSLKPQEIQVKSDRYVIIILRIDFKATIKTQQGEFKKVLIEIQKGKNDEDILRFRRYLSDNYRQQDEIKNDNGIVEKQNLPIIAIYFLGFKLKNIKTPVVKAARTYQDLITDEHFAKKEDFIEKLTHDGYFIQIPRLQTKDRNDLERVLKIFNQSYRSNDNRLIEISESELQEDPLLQKIGNRLLRAAANYDVLKKMDMEEEVESRIDKHIKETIELKNLLEEKDSLLEEKDSLLEEKDSLLEEKDSLLGEKEESAVKQLIEHTQLSDEQIAAMRNVSLEYVQKIRKTISL